jgi:hypothetical protein
MGTEIDLAACSDDDLLRLWKRIPEVLRHRGICRTSNIVSDVAERAVSQRLGLTLAANSTRGYDATAPTGERYQIKARLITAWNDSRQLSDIHHLGDGDPFEFLIAVFFRDDFPNVLAAHKLPIEVVRQFARKKGLRDVLIMKGPILVAPGVEDITSMMTSQKA